MAVIKGTFGKWDAVYDGTPATPVPNVTGVFAKWRDVYGEVEVVFDPGEIAAVTQYQPPMLQPIPAQVVGH